MKVLIMIYDYEYDEIDGDDEIDVDDYISDVFEDDDDDESI